MLEGLENKLTYSSYREMQVAMNGYHMFYDVTSSCVNVIALIEPMLFSKEIYSDFRTKFSESMQEKGKFTHYLTVMVVNPVGINAREEAGIARQYCDDDPQCWIYDISGNHLIIYENQISDFYGIKKIIEGPEPEITPQQERRRLPDFKRFIKGVPKATSFLVLINILIFVLCTFTGDLLYNRGAVGLVYMKDPSQWYRIVTAIFLHANSAHLFSNMLLLYYVGEIVERATSSLKFLLIYFAAGVMGHIATFAMEIIIGQSVLSIGASGAVFGCLGALVPLIVFRFVHRETLTLRRVLIMIALSLYNGFNTVNVNNAAHIGGVVTGFIVCSIVCFIIRRRRKGAAHEN